MSITSREIRAALVALTLAGVGAAPVLAQNLVVDGGFEDPIASVPFTTYNATTTFGGWTVSDGSVDLINGYWAPASGIQSLDLSGDTAGTIYQDLATAPGQAYSLSFDLSGNPDGGLTKIKSLLVSFGGSTLGTIFYDTTGNDRANMNWITEQFAFVATDTSTRLTFQSLDNSAYGPALDNIKVEAIPEAGTLTAFAAGAFPLGALVLRRRKA